MNPRLYRGLVPEAKRHRVANFHRKTLETALELAAAVGIAEPKDIAPEHFLRWQERQQAQSAS